MKKELNRALVGKNVSRYRKSAGLTQTQLAERVGCSSAYISSVECGAYVSSTRWQEIHPVKSLVSEETIPKIV